MFQFEMATLVPAFINMLNMFFCRYKLRSPLNISSGFTPMSKSQSETVVSGLAVLSPSLTRPHSFSVATNMVGNSQKQFQVLQMLKCLGLSSNTSSGFIFINIETQAETLVSGLAALSYSLTQPRSPPLLSIPKRWENVPTSWKKNKKTMVSRLQMLEWSVELWSDIVALVDSLPFFSSTSITKNMDGMSQHLVKNVQRFHAHKCLNAVS